MWIHFERSIPNFLWAKNEGRWPRLVLSPYLSNSLTIYNIFITWGTSKGWRFCLNVDASPATIHFPLWTFLYIPAALGSLWNCIEMLWTALWSMCAYGNGTHSLLKVQKKWHKEHFRVWEGAELIFYYGIVSNQTKKVVRFLLLPRMTPL